MADQPTQQSLHVPQRSASASKSVRDIMNAYNSQSKIELYGDESALSDDSLNGVNGRDIPLAALRPKQTMLDEEGNVIAVPSGARAKAVEDSRTIANAYRKMNGLPEEAEPTVRTALDDVPRYEAEYVEDMPNDDEGLLEILALAINNAKANLEMLQSLYAALSPS